MRAGLLACGVLAVASSARAEEPRDDDGRWELGFGAGGDYDRGGPGGMWVSAGPRFGRFALAADAALGWFTRFRPDGTPDYSTVVPAGGNDQRVSLVARVRLARIATGWSYGHRDRTALARTELELAIAGAVGGERIARTAMPTSYVPVASAAVELAGGFHWDAHAADHLNDVHLVCAIGQIVRPSGTAPLVTLGMRLGF